LDSINVAIAGIGNAASAFVQSLAYYKVNKDKNLTLNYPKIGGYSLDSIQIVGAFDVTTTKVGKNLKEAIFAEPNVARRYVEKDELLDQFSNIIVSRGPLLDGINETALKIVEIDTSSHEADIANVLKEVKAEILIALLPSGAEKATYAYAQAALDAGCAFINATPTQVATLAEWAQKFKKAGLPLVGDDLQSLVGGTRIHKGILELMKNFGVNVSETYQLDISGGSEALASLDSKQRLRFMKSDSKTESIRRANPSLKPENIASGTTDYLDFLENQRTGYFWIKTQDFLGGEIHMDLTVKFFDGPNAAGTLVDVVRATKLALKLALDGPAISISAFGFKNPPVYMQESEATQRFKEFVKGKKLV
jgi:myo-inositol-1-phosphate synthase